MPINPKTDRYKELDALRGIAALMIVLFHFTMGKAEAKYGFKWGITGVDLFFLISGFVIFMSLNKITKSVEFIINRISRLYPTYWTSVTFSFILLPIYSFYKNGFFAKIDLTQYFGNMTMFQFYLRIPDIENPYWTMIIEMLFYLGMLFLFHFKLLKYLNLIGITSCVLTVIMASLFGDRILTQIIIYWVPLLQFVTLFFAGTVFYKIYSDKNKLVENYLIIILCLISQILLFKYAGRSQIFISHTEYAVMLLIYFALFTLFVHHKLNFIVSKATLFFGEISFALYLIHQSISTDFIIPFLTKTLHFNFWVASFVVALPIVILIASFITYCIEIPIRRQMKEKLYTILNAE